MLLIKNVDLQISPNQRLVTNMAQHPQEEVTDKQQLKSIPISATRRNNRNLSMDK